MQLFSCFNDINCRSSVVWTAASTSSSLRVPALIYDDDDDDDDDDDEGICFHIFVDFIKGITNQLLGKVFIESA